jgi:hypothetical protein
MSRNKCFFQVRISPGLRLISICDQFTDSPSYIQYFPSCIIFLINLHSRVSKIQQASKTVCLRLLPFNCRHKLQTLIASFKIRNFRIRISTVTASVTRTKIRCHTFPSSGSKSKPSKKPEEAGGKPSSLNLPPLSAGFLLTWPVVYPEDGSDIYLRNVGCPCSFTLPVWHIYY